MNTHHNLNVWKLSIRLVTDIYVATKGFPVDEKYGLTSQLRRCAVSVPSNIAEGAARRNTNEFAHFLRISLGSLAELETQLIISEQLGFILPSDNAKLLSDRTVIAKQLQSLYNKIASKSQ